MKNKTFFFLVYDKQASNEFNGKRTINGKK